jgi:hypothetical protein
VDGQHRGTWVATSVGGALASWAFVEPGGQLPDATTADWRPSAFVPLAVRGTLSSALYPRPLESPAAYLARIDLPKGVRLGVLPPGAVAYVSLEAAFDRAERSWTWRLIHEQELARWNMGVDTDREPCASEIVRTARRLIGAAEDEPLDLLERTKRLEPFPRQEEETDVAYLARGLVALRNRGPGTITVTGGPAGTYPHAHVSADERTVSLMWAQLPPGDRQWSDQAARPLDRPQAITLLIAGLRPGWRCLSRPPRARVECPGCSAAARN